VIVGDPGRLLGILAMQVLAAYSYFITPMHAEKIGL
jgi:hypothetical protein